MARWPSEKDIETAILKPKEDGPIEWDVDRDSVKKAEGSFILVSGAHGDEAVEGVPYDKVWDPANQGPVTRVAYEQEDGKYRVILELSDTSAWSISRFMEEARDILRLQAPEAPAIWQAAWNKSGIYLKGRTNILGEGEETPLSNEPPFRKVRLEVLKATSVRSNRDEHADLDRSSASTVIDGDEEQHVKDKEERRQQATMPGRRSLDDSLLEVNKDMVGANQGKIDQDEEVDSNKVSSQPPRMPRKDKEKRLVIGAIDFECADPGVKKAGIPAIPVEGGIVLFDLSTGDILGHGHGLYYQDIPAASMDQARYTAWAVTGLPPATFVEVGTGRPPIEYEKHIHTFRDWANRLAAHILSTSLDYLC
ncbi:hypothetical protein J8273_1798 [Carpediemonas membranifera]|uniref:Uncharacterized protein n=1 Tax=Carpediemonas membranifera TaxID=201153 RepID=A0A8J6AWQ7_9EUKA|nr:hypothetical protein J8273_1798 [Carpediemonas membranifera]|eukprot:KAG9396766.1 hypothetical protein J8273_1798 [Carpediemonas membranifera]